MPSAIHNAVADPKFTSCPCLDIRCCGCHVLIIEADISIRLHDPSPNAVLHFCAMRLASIAQLVSPSPLVQPENRMTKSPSWYWSPCPCAPYELMCLCGMRASFERTVGCHWRICSYIIEKMPSVHPACHPLPCSSRRACEKAYHSMQFRLLEVVVAIHGIIPSVKKELGPLGVANGKATQRDALLVLR